MLQMVEVLLEKLTVSSPVPVAMLMLIVRDFNLFTEVLQGATSSRPFILYK